ncbi:MAG TPA: hypothetical protein V6D10_21995 [Trichocoleus sp.]|jgi:hypothetical protein
MRSNQHSAKQIPEEIGGTHVASQSYQENVAADAVADSLSVDDLYLSPLPTTPHRKHNPQAVNTKLKVKRLSEDRLIQISDELMQLAEKIRYFHPLMAEAIDEAWDATEEALRILSRDELW